MKTKIGLPFGLALVMFIGVFTAMLALGVLTPDRVDAAVDGATVMLEVSDEAVGTTPKEVMISFTNGSTTGDIVEEDGTLGLTFTGVVIDETEGAEDDNWSVSVTPDGGTEAELAGVTAERTSPTAVTLTFPNNIRDEDTDTEDIELIPPVPAEAMVVITFTADGDAPYTGIALNGGVINIATVSTENAVGVDVGGDPSAATADSTVVLDTMKVANFSVDNTVNRPGAVSGYRIKFMTNENLVSGEDVITVHFDKDFKGHGTQLSKSHVTVSASHPTDATTGDGETDIAQTGAFNPGSDASLDRLTRAKHGLSDKNTLNNIEYQILVPDMNGTSEGAPGIAMGSTLTVVISPGAGITNATEGGDKGPIGVFTSKQMTLAYDTVGVDRGIALSSYASNRNKSLTVVGSGFQDGTTATVYLKNDNGQRQELVNVPVASNDTFEAQFTVTVPPFIAGTANTIFAEDGNQPPNVSNELPFEVEGLLAVSPTAVAVGDEVDITLTDWPMNGEIPADAVTIAGVTQKIIGDTASSQSCL